MNIRKYFARLLKKKECNQDCVIDSILEKANRVDEARDVLNALMNNRINLLAVLESVEGSIIKAEEELANVLEEFSKIKIDEFSDVDEIVIITEEELLEESELTK
jgi:hypothetical protein